MNMVASELEKDPAIGLESLYARAKAIDSSVGELSLRQFHARYPLQVKRGKSLAEGKKPRRSARKKRATAKSGRERTTTGETRPRRAGGADRGESQREQLRSLFLEFATEFASAESRTEIVKVLSSVDAYVNRAEKLTSR